MRSERSNHSQASGLDRQLNQQIQRNVMQVELTFLGDGDGFDNTQYDETIEEILEELLLDENFHDHTYEWEYGEFIDS